MDDKIKVSEQPPLHGRAEIVSRFNFNQEVWFLNGLNICKGKIVGIKGEFRYKFMDPQAKLEVETSSGFVSSSFWVEEKELFESREDLVHRISTL